MTKNKEIFIGTSGWSYRDWKGNFYPEKTKSIDFLKYYAEKFKTVEVNSSFYHILKSTTIENWIQEVPNDFIFALKADRYITHIKKLEDPKQTIFDFMQSIKPFDNKLGPILYQLPPSMGYDAERLRVFVNELEDGFRYVFEFRNKSWFNEDTYNILKEKNIALCVYNIKGYQSPFETTADFTYFRLHGTLGLGIGKYSKHDIEELSSSIKYFVSQNKKVYCYFNNSTNGIAVENAQELLALF